jgi:opacity protein-like surface antigen
VKKKLLMLIVILLLVTGTVIAEEDNSELIGFPIIFSSPDTGLGAGGTGIYFKDTDDKKIEGSFVGFYTLEEQTNLIGQVEQTRDDYKYSLGLLYQDWPEKFYGLNNQIDFVEGKDYESQGFKIDLGVSKELVENNFLGLVGSYESYDLNLADQIEQEIPDGNGVDLLGLGVNYRFDTRDRTMNTRQGQYFVYELVAYNQDLADYKFLSHDLDHRIFKQLRPGHVLAWQNKLEINAGEVPFQQLASLGNMNILRGFDTAKYKAEDKVATQVEYRYPIYKQLSGTAFAGFGGVMDDLNSDYLKESWGLGLRYNINKQRGLNLRFDFAFNAEDGSFYFNFGEAF